MAIVHHSFAKGRRAHAVLAAAFVALAACRTASPLPTTTQPTPSQSRPERPVNQLGGASFVWGFTAPWDSRSDSSVRATSTKLDAVVTGWIQLDSATSLPSLLNPGDSTRKRGVAQRLTLVTSWHGQRFHPETVRRLGKDAAALALVASRVGALVAAGEYRGVVLDFEDQSPADLPITVRVASAIADSAKAHGATLAAIALPAADTAGYPTRAFIPALDLVVIMLYDEHWSTSAPGPVATPEWVRRTLSQRLADVGASRVVAALPVYGYQWRTNQPGQPVSFADARRAAFEANVELVRDPSSLSLHAIQPGSWELWMSDAQLLRALRAEVTSLGVSRIALWRLGLEDPGVWSVFDR